MTTLVINRAAQRVLALQEWWSAKSEFFSRLGSEEFTNGEVVLAHGGAVVLLLLAGIGGAL